MKLGMKVSLGPGDIVLNGVPAPQIKWGTSPTQFSAHVDCDQTAGWIKMRLDREIDLDPGDVVLDRVPDPCP